MKTKNITQFVMGSYDYDKMLEVKAFLDTMPNLEIVDNCSLFSYCSIVLFVVLWVGSTVCAN